MIFSTLLLAQTLFVKMPTGDIYQAVNDISQGQCVLTGTEELVFEANNFNTCNKVLLQPGCYRAELQGGVGTTSEMCLDHTNFDNMQTVSALFSLSEPTTIYALRGGDGNPGTIVSSTPKNYYGTFGGGASGVDSILVVGERVWRANGGSGKTCIMPTQGAILSTSGSGVSYGNGFGGNSDLTGNKNGFRRFYISNLSVNTSISSIGGGGGGGPNNAGGSNWSAQSNFPDDKIIINAGDNGTTKSGGNGGSINSCINMDCSETLFVSGGAGGANVSYECGGQMAYSYGGGGGGGAIYVNTSSSYYAKGGDGGSGSTGKSNTSFLRIYKM